MQRNCQKNKYGELQNGVFFSRFFTPAWRPAEQAKTRGPRPLSVSLQCPDKPQSGVPARCPHRRNKIPFPARACNRALPKLPGAKRRAIWAEARTAPEPATPCCAKISCNISDSRVNFKSKIIKMFIKSERFINAIFFHYCCT
jgi:hypothetical protein